MRSMRKLMAAVLGAAAVLVGVLAVTAPAVQAGPNTGIASNHNQVLL